MVELASSLINLAVPNRNCCEQWISSDSDTEESSDPRVDEWVVNCLIRLF